MFSSKLYGFCEMPTCVDKPGFDVTLLNFDKPLIQKGDNNPSMMQKPYIPLLATLSVYSFLYFLEVWA